jgi:hypothetical protein
MQLCDCGPMWCGWMLNDAANFNQNLAVWNVLGD